MFERARLNVPAIVPEFWMTTVPATESPGFIALAVRIAALSFELTIDSAPVANVFEGFAVLAVKFAPDPTATAPAARSAASAPRRRLGLRLSARRDVMENQP